MGSAGRLLSATAQRSSETHPPRQPLGGTGQGLARSASEGSLLNRGALANEMKKKILQVFCLKIQPGACFPSRGAAPSLAAPRRAPRAALPAQSPAGAGVPAAARCSPWGALCPAASGNPPRHLGRTRGGCFRRNALFLGLFSPFPPEGAAGEEADASWHGRSDFIPVAAVYAAVW